MRKGRLIFGGDFRVFLEIASFTLKLLFDVLFTSRLKDVVSLIFHFLAHLVLINVLLVVFIFNNRLFKRKGA